MPYKFSKTHCEVCGRLRTWGCGHERHHEIEAIKHRETEEHKTGACWHFDHKGCDPATCKNANLIVQGYAPFVHHRDAIEHFKKYPESKN